ncbi:MAG: hypothetical protein IKW89_13080 [Bacteroidales bacterium]|nr:hypothetical protein [Bacteroidales bacterium]
MKKWEDILKDRLEGYESTLPEGSLAEFRARRAAGGDVSRKKTHPLVWAMAAAVAAGLAAVLFLRKPVAPEDGIQVIQKSPVVQVQVDDTTDVVSPTATNPLIAQAPTPRVVRQPVIPELEEIDPIIDPEDPDVPETEEVVPQDAPIEQIVDQPVIADSSPFISQSSRDNAVKVNVVPGATIAGGGLATALVTQFASANALSPDQMFDHDNTDFTKDMGGYLHRMPVIIGFSIQIPVTEKLGIATGLEYSLYTSQYSSPFFIGARTQYVHYLGIPVRLDCTFASGRWFEAYAGAGVKGDFCLGATLEGMDLGKDGPAFRLLGAGGIQFKPTRHLGIYVEPGISWTLPSERRVLSTYSSEHPWMFTVATGLRVNFGK